MVLDVMGLNESISSEKDLSQHFCGIPVQKKPVQSVSLLFQDEQSCLCPLVHLCFKIIHFDTFYLIVLIVLNARTHYPARRELGVSKVNLAGQYNFMGYNGCLKLKLFSSVKTSIKIAEELHTLLKRINFKMYPSEIWMLQIDQFRHGL